MKTTISKPNITKSKVSYEVTRESSISFIEFALDKKGVRLSKNEADKVGKLMLAYEQEKQRLIARLSELEDVKVLNSDVAGQPIGIFVPTKDLENIKQELGI